MRDVSYSNRGFGSGIRNRPFSASPSGQTSLGSKYPPTLSVSTSVAGTTSLRTLLPAEECRAGMQQALVESQKRCDLHALPQVAYSTLHISVWQHLRECCLHDVALLTALVTAMPYRCQELQADNDLLKHALSTAQPAKMPLRPQSALQLSASSRSLSRSSSFANHSVQQVLLDTSFV